MAEVCDIYFARALDKRRGCQYNQEMQVTAAPEREENVHFLLLVIPIKILIVWMFLQHLFGG